MVGVVSRGRSNGIMECVVALKRRRNDEETVTDCVVETRQRSFCGLIYSITFAIRGRFGTGRFEASFEFLIPQGRLSEYSRLENSKEMTFNL